MRKVIVLGTSHPIQKGERGDEIKQKFKSFLKNIYKTYSIKMIAEEINEDANFIIAKELCKELGIKYKIIEPHPDKYEELDIKGIDIVRHEIHNKYYEYFDKYNILPNFLDNENIPKDIIDDYESKLYKEHSHPRECEWLKRIKEDDTSPILVIFGANHFDSFSKLLADNTIEVIKSDAYWGKEMEQNYK